MKGTRHTAAQMIETLRQADVARGQGQKVPDSAATLRILHKHTPGGVGSMGAWPPEMAKQLIAVDQENAQLKKLDAEQALDMEILKGAAKGNF